MSSFNFYLFFVVAAIRFHSNYTVQLNGQCKLIFIMEIFFFRLDGRVAVQGLVLIESCFPTYLKKTSFSIIAIVIVCCYLLCLKI